MDYASLTLYLDGKKLNAVPIKCELEVDRTSYLKIRVEFVCSGREVKFSDEVGGEFLSE